MSSISDLRKNMSTNAETRAEFYSKRDAREDPMSDDERSDPDQDTIVIRRGKKSSPKTDLSELIDQLHENTNALLRAQKGISDAKREVDEAERKEHFARLEMSNREAQIEDLQKQLTELKTIRDTTVDDLQAQLMEYYDKEGVTVEQLQAQLTELRKAKRTNDLADFQKQLTEVQRVRNDAFSKLRTEQTKASLTLKNVTYENWAWRLVFVALMLMALTS